MREKWRVKLAKALEEKSSTAGEGEGEGGRRKGVWDKVKRGMEKYAMFVLPFVTVLREGIEAIVFIAGVSFSAPATAVPLAVVVGLLVGIIAGYIIYK